MRRFLVAALIAAAACSDGSLTTGTSASTTTTTPVLTNAVAISGFAFVPPNVQVSPGAIVTFTNNDNTTHNVTFTSTAIASSGDFTTGSKSITMPATPGVYPFHCTIHAGMTGSVAVQ